MHRALSQSAGNVGSSSSIQQSWGKSWQQLFTLHQQHGLLLHHALPVTPLGLRVLALSLLLNSIPKTLPVDLPNFACVASTATRCLVLCRIVAVNKANGKESAPADVGTVKAAGTAEPETKPTPPTSRPIPLRRRI
jgi:hypothetical protein